MVSFWRVNYPFREWYLFAEVCSRNLQFGNSWTNPGYLDVETILSTPLAVETKNQQTTQES